MSFEDQVGTSPVRDQHRFDEAALASWMHANVAGYAGPLVVEQFKGGQSNPTYKLVTPGRSYVMRRKPPGHLVAGAHAVDREARVLSALEGTGVPVAHVYGLCTDDSVIGTWFFIMDMVEGRIFWGCDAAECLARGSTRLFRCDECGHRRAAPGRSGLRPGWATMASRAITLRARLRAGAAPIWKMSMPVAIRIWTG